MAEWLIEDGIGERRAALVDAGRIIEARIERDSDGFQASAVIEARRMPGTVAGAALMVADSGEELLCRPAPQVSEGAKALVCVTRTALPERGLTKRALARPAQEGEAACPAPTLAEAIGQTGHPVRPLRSIDSDALEAAGWSEMLDSAASGLVPFAGGLLRIDLTAAMTVIDVDGDLPPAALATTGCIAAAAALRLFDITGSIVIDLPGLGGKAERIAAAEAFDAAMTGPFERTAVNGWGLMQIIRPRTAMSLIERQRFSPVESAALAALRRAERAQGSGPLMLRLHPAVAAWLIERPALTETLGRRTGRPPVLIPEAEMKMGACDVG